MKKNYFATAILGMVFSFSNLNAQTPVADVPYASGSFVNNQTLYTCTQGGKIYKTDLTEESATPELILSTPVSVSDLIVIENKIIFTDYTMGQLLRCDLSPETLWDFDTLMSGILHPTKLLKDGDDLYVSQADQSKISKIDLSKETLVAEEVVSGIPGAWGIAKKDDSLYVASISMREVYRIDLTQSNPVAQSIYTSADQLTALSIVGDKLYVAEYRNGNLLEFDLNVKWHNPNTVLTGAAYIYGLHTHLDELYISQLIAGKVSKLNGLVTGKESIAVNQSSLYPNPAQNMVFLNEEIGSYSILNLVGKA